MSPTPPISIDTSPAPQRGRSHSMSNWSNPGLSPSVSPASSLTSSIKTPSSSFSNSFNFPRNAPASPTSTTSPLSYFLNGSPAKSSFPFTSASMGTTYSKNNSNAPQGKPLDSLNGSAIAEDDDVETFASRQSRLGHHPRASSGNWANIGQERGAGVMRRLSLGGALAATRPTPAQLGKTSPPVSRNSTTPPPVNVTASSGGATYPDGGGGGGRGVNSMLKPPSSPASPIPRRRGTAGRGDPIKKRGVSPMGERMLKGHFDGFGL